MSDIDRRLEAELARGHPEEDQFVPPRWEEVRAADLNVRGRVVRPRSSSALLAAAVAVTLLLIGLLAFGLIGSFRPNLLTTPSTPSNLETPRSAADVSPSPSPSSSPAGTIHLPEQTNCGSIDRATCDRLVAEIGSLEHRPIASIALEPYSPYCRTACANTGFPWNVRVIGTAADGSGIDWICSTDPNAPNCALTPEAQRTPPANLVVRAAPDVVGIVLEAPGKDVSVPIEPGKATAVPAGNYLLRAEEGCSASKSFDAVGGAQIKADITGGSGGACTISVVITEATKESCQISLAQPTVRVGAFMRIEASGLTAYGDGAGLGEIHRDGADVPLVFTPQGTLARIFVTGRWMVGSHHIRIMDSTTGCEATTTLRVTP